MRDATACLATHLLVATSETDRLLGRRWQRRREPGALLTRECRHARSAGVRPIGSPANSETRSRLTAPSRPPMRGFRASAAGSGVAAGSGAASAPLAALSRFATCSDEMLVPRGKEVSTLVAYGPRRRMEHQFVEQIAVAVPKVLRTRPGGADLPLLCQVRVAICGFQRVHGMSPLRSRSSAPSLRWLCPTERIPGGHTSVGAMPRSYQVTPAILDGGARHGKSRSDPKVDRRKESQPAAVREPNRRAGRHRPSGRQLLTEARSRSLVVRRRSPAYVLAR